jgi:protein-S-isoprenylcysteine O-methyltransferase Ste14
VRPEASLGHHMRSLHNKIPPPLVGVLVALAMCLASSVGPAWAFSPVARNVAVAIFVVAGLTFDVLGLLAFRAARTTANPLKPERASALVTGGIYRLTRNPMYVGTCCILLAWAVYLSALLPFAGPAVFAMYMTRFQIQPEEQALSQLFGEQYAQYTARVRRWL